MGYILILLVFLIYRNTVNIRKAVYYTAYGNEYKTGIIKKMFITLANIRKEEKEEKQKAKQQRQEEQEEKEIQEKVKVRTSEQDNTSERGDTE